MSANPTAGTWNIPPKSATMQQFGQQCKRQPVESKPETVNSFPALAIVADQVPDQQQPQTPPQTPAVRPLTYLMQADKTICAMLGASNGPDFATHFPVFGNSMQSFRRLTDPDKLNRKPARVRIKSVTSSSTLSQALTRFQVPRAHLAEMALLNGMPLPDRLSAGTLIKVVGQWLKLSFRAGRGIWVTGWSAGSDSSPCSE